METLSRTRNMEPAAPNHVGLLLTAVSARMHPAFYCVRDPGPGSSPRELQSAPCRSTLHHNPGSPMPASAFGNELAKHETETRSYQII